MRWLTPQQAIQFAESVTGTKPADWINWMQAVFRLAKDGRLNIFVIGCGGTGKTSFSKYTVGKNTEQVPSKHISTTVRRRDSGQKLESFARIYDYPGQPSRFKKEFNNDWKAFNSSRRNIVLHCCAYGYHSDWGQGGSFGEKPEALAPTTTDMQTALADCREAELRFARDLLSKCELYKHRLDMLTLILKQDLWFDRFDEAGTFHSNEYMPIVEEYARNRDNFTHEIFPLCLRRENLQSRIGALSENAPWLIPLTQAASTLGATDVATAVEDA